MYISPAMLYTMYDWNKVFRLGWVLIVYQKKKSCIVVESENKEINVQKQISVRALYA